MNEWKKLTSVCWIRKSLIFFTHHQILGTYIYWLVLFLVVVVLIYIPIPTDVYSVWCFINYTSIDSVSTTYKLSSNRYVVLVYLWERNYFHLWSLFLVCVLVLLLETLYCAFRFFVTKETAIFRYLYLSNNMSY